MSWEGEWKKKIVCSSSSLAKMLTTYKNKRTWYSSSWLEVQLLRRQKSGGSQFKASPDKKLVKPHLNKPGSKYLWSWLWESVGNRIMAQAKTRDPIWKVTKSKNWLLQFLKTQIQLPQRKKEHGCVKWPLESFQGLCSCTLFLLLKPYPSFTPPWRSISILAGNLILQPHIF
jgi:hypothetical protein